MRSRCLRTRVSHAGSSLVSMTLVDSSDAEPHAGRPGLSWWRRCSGLICRCDLVWASGRRVDREPVVCTSDTFSAMDCREAAAALRACGVTAGSLPPAAMDWNIVCKALATVVPWASAAGTELKNGAAAYGGTAIARLGLCANTYDASADAAAATLCASPWACAGCGGGSVADLGRMRPRFGESSSVGLGLARARLAPSCLPFARTLYALSSSRNSAAVFAPSPPCCRFAGFPVSGCAGAPAAHACSRCRARRCAAAASCCGVGSLASPSPRWLPARAPRSTWAEAGRRRVDLAPRAVVRRPVECLGGVARATSL